MRRLVSVALALVMAVGVGLPYDAEAKKRLGGGSSFGRTAPVQRQATPPQAPATPSAQPAAPNAPAAQPAARPATAGAAPQAAAQSRSRWLGPVAGLAAGLGLAFLASSLGIGEEMMSLMLILLAVVAVVFVVRMIMSRGRAAQPAGASYGASAGYGQQAPMAREAYQEEPQAWQQAAAGSAGSVAASASAAAQPSQADIDAFLEGARDQFMALQAHWDAGRLAEIEKFTTPAVAAVFEQQHNDRLASGESTSTTRVVQLDLEWYGMSQSTGDRGQAVDEALVRFYGLIRESDEGVAEAFDEVWTLHRDRDGQAGWLVAGITQRAAG